MNKTYYVEEVKSRIGRHVLSSNVREATKEDIQHFQHLHDIGGYKHDGIENLIEDTQAYMYDFRSCAICGYGLGTV